MATRDDNIEMIIWTMIKEGVGVRGEEVDSAKTS